MSNDSFHEQSPNPEPESMSAEERQTAERSGHLNGESWAQCRAGNDERKLLLRCDRRQRPDLRQYRDVSQAILAFVRIIHPPCSLHVVSARACW